MARSIRLILCLTVVSFVLGGAEHDPTFETVLRPFLKQHCSRCHSPEKKKGGVDLSLLDSRITRHAELLQGVLVQLNERLMPPQEEMQPIASELETVTAWLRAKLPSDFDAVARQMPRGGNLVPHEKLFANNAPPTRGAPARIWRLRPDAYMGFLSDVANNKIDKIVQPFGVIPDAGFKDYSALYTVDEASTEILIRNASEIVTIQTAFEMKDGKWSGKGGLTGEFKSLFDPNQQPSPKMIEDGIRSQFRLAIFREPDSDELKRLVEFYARNRKVSEHPAAMRATLAAVLLRADAVYRMEIGEAPSGRRLLAPRETARALSLALFDRNEKSLFAAANKGDLNTPGQVESHIRRLLDSKQGAPRILAFFREYFGYGFAPEIFKDKPADVLHEPQVLVSDTDRLIKHILAKDKNVLEELLTTQESFANYGEKDKKPAPFKKPHPPNDGTRKGPEAVYGFDAWPEAQPARMPEGQRMGVLTQPSWLIAHSTNFDNDPVRRGRWIRERLLGGTVPELPIGVVAQIPDDPHRTLRDRFGVTRAAQCWKCHQRMDELGLPFEQFDHYGKFRSTEKVRDLEATAKNVDKKGKPLGPVLMDLPLNTGGTIANSGDPMLDGPVKNANEMIQKLAKSERVRQVFVRHVFRFMLGRNETLDDAQTLQRADRAYVESGGSFKALLVSLLSSDSFLYRADSAAASASK